MCLDSGAGSDADRLLRRITNALTFDYQRLAGITGDEVQSPQTGLQCRGRVGACVAVLDDDGRVARR